MRPLRLKKTHAAVTQEGTAISRYQNVVVGERSLWRLIYFEFCLLLSPIPGALGIFMRKLFWPRLFGACGSGVVFSTNVVLRHPHRISIGDRVVISDGCILDARNDDLACAIELSNDVILSNGVMISCKNGYIKIGANTGINAYTIVQSINRSPVIIGQYAIIGPRCYIVGGANYNTNRHDIPICQQGIKEDDGVIISNDVWLGANVTILGGG